MPVPVRAGARGRRRGRCRASCAGRRCCPRGQLHFFLWDARPQSAKAQRELGLGPHPARAGPARGGVGAWLTSAGRESGGLPGRGRGCSTAAPRTCTTASRAGASARCGCSSARSPEPGNASSAEVVWVAELDGALAAGDGRVPRRRRRSGGRAAFLGLALRRDAALALAAALRLYWAAAARPRPAALGLLRRRARHRPRAAAPRRRARRCSRGGAPGARARAALGRARHDRAQRAGARPLRERGLRGGRAAPAGGALPGFVALVKPLP